jgi:uncharacterized protein (DUF2147 family)
MAALVLAGTAAASPAEGVWRTPVDDSDIQLYDCGPALCGRVVGSNALRLHPELRNIRDPDPARRNLTILGLTFLQGFVGGPPRWRFGSIYNPNDGHTYHGTITLKDANTLRLQGCIIFPLCASQTWVRKR